MEPTYPIFELDLTLELSYLCTKFGVKRIEIVISSVHTYTYTYVYVYTYYIHTYLRKILVDGCPERKGFRS